MGPVKILVPLEGASVVDQPVHDRSQPARQLVAVRLRGLVRTPCRLFLSSPHCSSLCLSCKPQYGGGFVDNAGRRRSYLHSMDLFYTIVRSSAWLSLCITSYHGLSQFCFFGSIAIVLFSGIAFTHVLDPVTFACPYYTLCGPSHPYHQLH